MEFSIHSVNLPVSMHPKQKTDDQCQFLKHQSSLGNTLTFMIVFQLSPVAIRNNVRNAIPKFLKCACLSRPLHGYFSLHSNLPNNSTPRAVKMKKRRKNNKPYHHRFLSIPFSILLLHTYQISDLWQCLNYCTQQ